MFYTSLFIIGGDPPELTLAYRPCGADLPSRACWFAAPCNGKRTGGDIFGDGGTGGYIAALSNGDGRHHIGIAADETVILYGAAVLALTIVVDGNGAAAEIDALPQIGVAYIGEMGNLCAVADGGVFQLLQSPRPLISSPTVQLGRT